MSAVLQASGYARRLVDYETRRSGVGVRSAIPAVARRVKAPPGSIWALLFRPPKRIYSDLADTLAEAVAREIRREISELENELAAITSNRAVGPGDHISIEEIETDLSRLKTAINKVRPAR